MTAFIAANGHTPMAALYPVASTAPTRLSTRNRSTRACMSEMMTRIEPAQPMTSSMLEVKRSRPPGRARLTSPAPATGPQGAPTPGQATRSRSAAAATAAAAPAATAARLSASTSRQLILAWRRRPPRARR